jgi:hypothetical protein
MSPVTALSTSVESRPTDHFPRMKLSSLMTSSADVPGSARFARGCVIEVYSLDL